MKETSRIECPQCGQKGRKVHNVTLNSLLKEPRQTELADQAHRFCRTADCDVVYFGERHEEQYLTGDLTATVFQKSEDPARLVCYCFNHSVQSIGEEVSAAGTSGVPDSIGKKCKAGLDDCERNNPQGSCCLGNVRKVVKLAIEANGGATSPAAAEADDCCSNKVEQPSKAGLNPEENNAPHDCCAADEHDDTPDGGGAEVKTATPTRSNSGASAGLLSSGGAVVAALFASACCWLPLALAGVGASTVGLAGFFEAYRPYFLGATALLLAGGFYYVYLRKPKCGPGEACEVPNPRLQTLNKITLWVATILVVTFATFPNYVGALYGDGGAGSVEAAQAPRDVQRTYPSPGPEATSGL